MERPALPAYEAPPVDEVVLGVQFHELQHLLIPHFGLFWERFRAHYPTCEHAAPIAHIVEQRGGPAVAPMDPNDLPLPRVLFVSDTDNEVVQMQRDRFLFNWRRRREEDRYPGFSAVRDRFEHQLSEFETFLHENGLGTLGLDQFELTYIDIFEHEHGWTNVGTIGRLLPDLAWRSTTRFLEDPHSLRWQAAFDLPGGAGRLHVSLQLAGRLREGQSPLPVLRFEMTARGIGPDTSLGGRRAWFDRAHEKIVLGFADLTSEEAQTQLWKRLQ